MWTQYGPQAIKIPITVSLSGRGRLTVFIHPLYSDYARKGGAKPMEVNRREVLSGIASASVATLGTTVLLDNSVGTAEASVSMEQLSIDNAEKTTRDGTVSDVGVSISGNWEYDLPSGKNPSLWQVVLWIHKDGEKEPVGLAESDAKYLSGSGSYEIQGSLIASELYSQSDFAATEEGATEQTDIRFELVFNVFNDSESVLATSSLETKSTVEVTNDEYSAEEHGKVGGDGELQIIG